MIFRVWFRVWQRTMAAVVTDERMVALLREHRTVEDCRIHRRGSDPLSASACRTIKTQESVTGAEAVTALIAVHSVQCGWQGRDRCASQSVNRMLTGAVMPPEVMALDIETDCATDAAGDGRWPSAIVLRCLRQKAVTGGHAVTASRREPAPAPGPVSIERIRIA